jgi:hypothetical protein
MGLCLTESKLFDERNNDVEAQDMDACPTSGSVKQRPRSSIQIVTDLIEDSSVIDKFFRKRKSTTTAELTDPANMKAVLGQPFTINQLLISSMRIPNVKDVIRSHEPQVGAVLTSRASRSPTHLDQGQRAAISAAASKYCGDASCNHSPNPGEDTPKTGEGTPRDAGGQPTRAPSRLSDFKPLVGGDKVLVLPGALGKSAEDQTR